MSSVTQNLPARLEDHHVRKGSDTSMIVPLVAPNESWKMHNLSIVAGYCSYDLPFASRSQRRALST